MADEEDVHGIRPTINLSDGEEDPTPLKSLTDNSFEITSKSGIWKYHALILLLITEICLLIGIIQTLCYFIYLGGTIAILPNFFIVLVWVLNIVGYVFYLVLNLIYKRNIKFKYFCDRVLKCCQK